MPGFRDPGQGGRGRGASHGVRPLAGREAVDIRTAPNHAVAVFAALGTAVSSGELRGLEGHMPADR